MYVDSYADVWLLVYQKGSSCNRCYATLVIRLKLRYQSQYVLKFSVAYPHWNLIASLCDYSVLIE